ncbi:Uncharacterised protein [Streptococcus pneumoniae]|nr:Uncharacterised protein [Streptococcus pneumoniae]
MDKVETTISKSKYSTRDSLTYFGIKYLKKPHMKVPQRGDDNLSEYYCQSKHSQSHYSKSLVFFPSIGTILAEGHH